MGMRPDTVVPSSGALRTSSVPPSAASRSAMFCSPIPYGGGVVSNPRPSSSTENARSPAVAAQADDGVRGLRVLRHVLQRLEHREVDGRLDVARVAADAVVRRPSPGPAPCAPAPRAPRADRVGQQRRVDPAREVAQVLERVLRVVEDAVGAPRAVACSGPARPAVPRAAPSRPARPAAAARRRGCCARAGGAPRPARPPSRCARRTQLLDQPEVLAGPGRPARRGRRSSLSSSGRIGSLGGFVTVSAPSSSLPCRTATAASTSGNAGSPSSSTRSASAARRTGQRRGRAHLGADAQPHRRRRSRRSPRPRVAPCAAGCPRRRTSRPRARRTPTAPRTAWRACRRSRGSRCASRDRAPAGTRSRRPPSPPARGD